MTDPDPDLEQTLRGYVQRSADARKVDPTIPPFGPRSPMACMWWAVEEIDRLRAVVAALDGPGVVKIAAERHRQTSEEGRTAEHDDQHTKGELAFAAAHYATEGAYPLPPGFWSHIGPYTRDLVRAGALIAAEIDRHLRAGGSR